MTKALTLLSNNDAIFTGNITASGNISASSLIIENELSHAGDNDTRLSFGDDSVRITAGNVVGVNITGGTTGSGVVMTERIFEKTSSTDGDHSGDIVYFGSTTSMDVGQIYHYKSDGTWEKANASAASTCDGLLGVALGPSSNIDGVLLRGMVTLDHDPGAVGDVLFVKAVAGSATSVAPGATQVIRIIGYCIDASNGQIWFNPDNTFVEVAE
tara:strand:- start:158 stop:796 length:639 start_codon:yes stop_codon:yes gene_type:complete